MTRAAAVGLLRQATGLSKPEVFGGPEDSAALSTLLNFSNHLDAGFTCVIIVSYTQKIQGDRPMIIPLAPYTCHVLCVREQVHRQT